MSSKQQLMDYNKRLKKTIIEKDKLILQQEQSLISLRKFVKLYHEEMSRAKVFWYDKLYKQSMISELKVLEIGKQLNYVSRTTRDIILGGNYDKNIEKLNKSISTIEELFISLEDIMKHDDSLHIVTEAKDSTIDFLNSSFRMMKNLNKDDIDNNKKTIYLKYKNDLTPLANASRVSFKKLSEIKDKELFDNSESLLFLMNFYKIIVFSLGLVVAIIVFIVATLIRKSITTVITDFTDLIKLAAAGDFNNECKNICTKSNGI